MDNFMENPWFVRIIAMLLAVLLFITANDLGAKDKGSTPNNMENNDSDTITDFPVEVYYDSENLVVSGVPEMVDVKIEGQRRFVEAAKRQRDFTVYVDLSNLEIGKHRVPILYKDISDKLKVTIEPSYIEVNVQEKVTDEYSVEAEFNRRILAEGFEAEQPEVKPKTVKITGAKDVIKRIAYVKATIDASGLINDTIRRDAHVTVLDRDLNKLEVMVEPETVAVTIPVTNPRKNVPIKINKTGEPPKGIEIKAVSTVTPEVVIFGTTEVLKDINELEVSVDVSNIEQDTEVEVPLNIPEGVNKITPETIKVKITADKEKKEKTFDNVSIESKGLKSGMEFDLLSPGNGSVSLKVFGDEKDLAKASKEQFHVVMDLSGLDTGTHDADLTVDGPKNMEWELSEKKAKVRIREKETD
ncbi:CdaR family protein [Lederbergia sp. NSJ-179]|uniref:CdaR family protein n=1 Tax=Lederbergia sp. NSJ-179 TaxID=2931402 RepID=UPI001FCF8088|nr:CdaR family protein [Lederbergia sp. NSJ-179]MCJ7840010.1 CdaR family protein [Lederbergia sp. NSJ-179]